MIGSLARSGAVMAASSAAAAMPSGCGQLGDDLVDDGVVRFVARLHDDVRLRVDRLAQRQQVRRILFRSSGRSLRRLMRLHQHVEVGLQPDRDALDVDRVAGVWSMNAPPPVASTCGPLSSSRAITRASPARKYGSPCVAKISGDGHAGGTFDLGVGIDETDAEPGGEPAADRRLAGAHHADQHDRTAARAPRRSPRPCRCRAAF